MFVLDTNVFTSIWRNSDSALANRIRQTPERVALSVVAAEEIVRGCLNGINTARQPQNTKNLTHAYAFFEDCLREISKYGILPYDERCIIVFNAFPKNIKQLHPQDCRIAATAIVHGYTVVTANTRHFAMIPGVSYVDWTVEVG